MNFVVEDADAVETAEAIVIGDDRLVKVIIKIRDEIAKLNKEYDDAIGELKKQKLLAETEILRRLQERGSTQTKTQHGTSFIEESMQITIADEAAYERFVLEQQDTEFYQKRAKVEHVQKWMAANEGRSPPGLSFFRELKINTRAPRRKGSSTTATTEQENESE